MRFLLFDRLTHVEPGAAAHGIKCISAAEDVLEHHFPRQPLYPPPLVLEAMVQVLAWAAISGRDFAVSTVMAGVNDVSLPTDLRPGDVMEIRGTLLGSNRRGSMGHVEAFVGGEPVAQVGKVLFGHVADVDAGAMRARFAYLGGVLA